MNGGPLIIQIVLLAVAATLAVLVLHFIVDAITYRMHREIQYRHKPKGRKKK